MTLKGTVKLDDRGRFVLPSDIFRDVNTKAGGRYVLTRSTDKCITLYPGNIWDIVSDRLNRINVFDPKKRALVRYFLGNATEITLDGKNRISLPKDLKNYAGIDKELLVIKLNPFIELWDPQCYNKQMENTLKFSSDDISAIANEIFNEGNGFNLP
ncbi:MAG: division/cell wall cluster transcriptional repressor MraZ [Bacteroidales bacterium]|nr:division/cell wall cluster transcriptional repressor MraZ [Bacteroidales bacterium]